MTIVVFFFLSVCVCVCGEFTLNLKSEHQILKFHFFSFLDYSLFTHSEDGNLAWFNAFSFEADVMFELVGILLGLAIYNGIILDVHFPLLVYKKLLGFDIGLADLREIQPTVSNSLEQLLQYTGDVENDYCLTFEVSYLLLYLMI